MSEAQAKGTVQRILIALDASPHSLAALRVAVDLAAHLRAELIGLYVEDITLLRLSDLPASRRVSAFTIQAHPLDREHVQAELRAQARQARRALAEAASRAHLRWSFRVAQGVITRELLSAAQEVDLLLVGKSGWSRRRHLGSTTRVLVQEAPGRLMVLQQGARLALPVGVVYDGSEAAGRGLAMAIDLLQKGNGYLTVLVAAEDLQTAREIQAQSAANLHGHDLPVRFRWLIKGSPDTLLSMVESESCGVLVLPGESQILASADLADLINRVECPVLLVR